MELMKKLVGVIAGILLVVAGYVCWTLLRPLPLLTPSVLLQINWIVVGELSASLIRLTVKSAVERWVMVKSTPLLNRLPVSPS